MNYRRKENVSGTFDCYLNNRNDCSFPEKLSLNLPKNALG